MRRMTWRAISARPCYEDQRSTVLAVDNLNGGKVLGRIIKVDHVEDYKLKVAPAGHCPPHRLTLCEPSFLESNCTI